MAAEIASGHRERKLSESRLSCACVTRRALRAVTFRARERWRVGRTLTVLSAGTKRARTVFLLLWVACTGRSGGGSSSGAPEPGGRPCGAQSKPNGVQRCGCVLALLLTSAVGHDAVMCGGECGGGGDQSNPFPGVSSACCLNGEMFRKIRLE